MDRKSYLPKITKEDEKIIEIFQKEMDKINLLYMKAIKSDDISKANQLLKQIKKISNYLNSQYGERADIRIPQEYVKGSSYIDEVLELDSIALDNLKDVAIQNYLDELGPIHKEAVNALLNNSKNYVKSSLDGMERQAITMVNELQQEKVREELAKGIVEGTSANKKLAEYFLDNGITGFKDRGGKYWSMERYIDMLTRTETSIANIQGTINRALQLGITKFRIIEKPDCCEECAELDGTIVDISEGVVDLPPFHPNCRGYIVAVIEDEEGNETDIDLREDKSEDEDRAKTPEERMKKVFDVIENSTMYLNHEQASLVNLDGKIIRTASGLSGSVVTPRGDIEEPYILTHNHPNSSSFSQRDLKNWYHYDNEYGLRASSKVGTYYLYAERKIDKVLFMRTYNSLERSAVRRGKNDMKTIADAWRSGSTKDYIKYKDGSYLYYKDDPYTFDKIVDEHYYKHLREAIKEAADYVPGVEFEYIESDGIQKDTKLNQMYLDKIEELDKLRKKKIKKYEDNIPLNDYI